LLLSGKKTNQAFGGPAGTANYVKPTMPLFAKVGNEFFAARSPQLLPSVFC
jgi:hypothetical protein